MNDYPLSVANSGSDFLPVASRLGTPSHRIYEKSYLNTLRKQAL